MPRALVPAGRWREIGAEELAAWKAQREADRVKLRRPWLRYPVEPMSWVADKEREKAARAVAHALEGAVL